MSFQDVGRGGTSRVPPKRRSQQTNTSSPSRAAGGGGGGAFSSAYSSGGGGGGFAAAAAGSGAGLDSAASGVGGGNLGGYEQVSDGIVQYQRNVALLEKMARSVGTKNDTSVLKTQYNLQLEVIQQLGTRIETNLRTQESHLSTLPRAEASQSRTTHVKLTRDYRLVEQKFKHVQLDVRKKRSLAEVKARERSAVELEEEEERRRRNANNNRNGIGGGFGGGGEMEEGMRRQMQLQDDRINEEIMREREEEIRNIHKGMHQVNEIYKDLAHLVDSQQEGIDQIETQMENTNENTKSGLKHIEKANESQQSQCIIS